MESNLVLWAGLILFALLGLKLVRTVIKARYISGVVVTADVQGDVIQQQTPQSPPQPKPPLWRDLLTLTNVALAVIASALMIGRYFLN